MKRLYFLCLFCLFIFRLSLYGQCPPPGFPDAGNTCATAPILCENLDGYCSTINNNNVQQNFPGCGGNFVLNNDEWFAFFAGSTSISIQVTPSNCSQGSQMGLQGGIYNGCGGAAMAVQCACSQNPFVLTSNNYVIGQIYWFVLDGCAGNVCDYSIDVLSGSTVGVPPNNPGTITGPINVCPGTNSSYNLPAVFAATMYNWTLTPAGVGTINGNNTLNPTINWNANATGMAQLCVTASNACYGNMTPSCIDITINPKPTAMISGSGLLCAGSPSMVNLPVTFTGNAPWTFVYTINGVPQPAITTSTNPYIIVPTQPGTYGLLSVNTAGCQGTVSGTAPVTQTTVTGTTAVTAAQCGQSNGSINLTPGGGTLPYMFLWGGGQTTEDLSNVPAGNYIVTITDANGCTKTATAVIADNPINVNVTGTVVANTICNGGNGSIDVSVAPAAGTYTYIWSNGAMTQDLTGLMPGSYTVTVTTGVTCTGTATFTIADNPNQPTVNSTHVNTTCDFSNGSIDVTASGGVAPYTYMWGGGQTTEDLTNIPAGSYTVTVTGANGCTRIHNVTVTNTNPPIGVTGVVVANTTCTGGNGSIDVSVNPASGTYTYIWSNGAMTQDITNLTPGSYTITVSAGGSCTQTASFTVNDNPSLPTVTSTVINTTCDFSNGSINVTASGGVAPYTFMWGGGQTTEDLSNIPAGSYSVTVTGANGCTRIHNVTVTNTNPPITVTGTVLANTTCNGSNGSIDVSVNPAGTYTYIWSNGAITQDVNMLPGGSYTVTVSAGGSCTNSATFVIPDIPNTPVVNATITNTTCDLANGSINLSVTGGVPPYTYLWSTGATTVSITNQLANSYQVTVTGANGCTTAASFNIANINPQINITAFVLPNSSCNAATNGSIDVTVAPASAYTYVWSNGAMTQDLTGLASGTYIITVSGGGSCTNTASFTVDDVPNVPILTFTTVDAHCGLNNGSINLTVASGVQPFTYQWSNGSTVQDPNNVPGDDYTVTVTGSNGCSTVGNVTVPNVQTPITVNATIKNQTSCVANNGMITLQLTPSNMTVVWSTGSTSTVLNNLAPGDYTVTVSAGGTCTETATFTVADDSEAATLGVNITPANCGLNNGAVDLDVSGGIAPYTYKWSNNSTFQDINNLLAGNYAVTVTTSVGCTSVIFAPVPSEDIPIEITGVVFDNNSCSSPNGEIDINVAPDGLAYKYKWSNNKITEDLSNLTPGIYTVTVSYGISCSAVATFEVLNVALLPTLSVLGLPATCGLNNGGADLSVTGGTPSYTYKWSNMATTQDLNNILPGTYTVTVKDFFDCSATATVVVANNNVPLNITGTVTPNTSCSAPNGGVNISVSPAGTYTYHWSNMATTEDLTNLPAGTYIVTVTAGTSCTGTASFTVTNNTADPNISPVVTPAICGNSNGGINLTITGGGTPYIFAWSNMATTEDLNNIPAGNYTVTVTSANGCTADTTLNVPNNASTFSLSGVATPLNNCTAPNGSINLTVTPAGTYTFAWSNMATTEDLNNLPAGTYTVSVTETGNCVANASFIIVDERTYPATTQAITPEVCGLSNGALNLGVSGGTAPYTFSWATGQITEDLSAVPAGPYAVTVTDAKGCTTTASATLPANTISFSLSATTTASVSCILNNGTVDLDVTPVGTYTYMWSNSATTQDLGPVGGGNYTVTVSAGGTCTSTGTYTVASAATAPSINETITPASCGQSSGAINLTVFSGVTPYTFSWASGQMTEDLANIPAGTYAVTVTGANSCTTANTYNVTDAVIDPVISGITTPNSLCVGSNGSINLSVSPTLNYTYVWSSGQMTQNLSNVTSGDYTVTVNGGGACTGTATFTVGSNIPAPQMTGSITTAYCGQATGSINLTVNSGISPYTYNWSNTVVAEDLNAVTAGNYIVTVSSANGCTSTATYTVPDSVIVPTITGVPTASTSCVVSNGAIDLSVTPSILTYTYAWSNSVTMQDLANIASGDYTVTVNGGAACTNTATFTVGSNTPSPQMTGNITTAYCGLATGSIDLTVSSGVAPFMFTWSNSGSAEDLNTVTTGDYTVTVSSSNGCTSTATYTVPDSTIALTISGVPTASSSCIVSNGAIDLSVTPNILTYTYVWSTSATTQDLTDLAPGDYTVTVNGGAACTNTATITVGSNTPSPQMTGNIGTAFCAQSTGNIDLTVNSGVAPFTFVWSTNALTEDVTTLATGSYTVTVSSANGCTASATYMVPDSVTIPVITPAIVTNTSCVANNGAISLTVAPSILPYTFAWAGGQTTANLTGLAPGDYTVTVSGGGGCNNTATITVPTSTAIVTVTGTDKQILCFGQNDGEIHLTVTGGNAPFTYVWSPTQPGSPLDLTNLAAGNYAFTATDVNGCSGSASFSIQQPTSAVQLICGQSGNVSAPGAMDGAAKLAISGGVAPYSVTWSPGTTQTNVAAGDFFINNLGVGNYAATVTDANGCTTQCNFGVGLVICKTAVGTMSATAIMHCGTGCVTTTYTATGQFLEVGDVLQYILHTGNGGQIQNEIARSNQPTFCFDPALMSYGTTYYISVAAGNNDGSGNVDLSDFCTVVAPGTPILFRAQPVSAIVPPVNLTCLVKQATLTGSATVASVVFSWTTTGGGVLIGSTNQATATAGAAGLYTLVVDNSGCADTSAVQVKDLTNYPEATILANPGDLLDCTIDEIILSGTTEGTTNANLVWISNGVYYATGSVVPINAPGLYEFVIVDTLSFCRDTANILIDQDQAYPPLFIQPPSVLTCAHPNATITGGSPFPGIQFVWVTISGTDTTTVGNGPTLPVVNAGTYYLIGSDPANQCTNILSTVVLADLALPTANAGAPFSIACFGEIGTLDGSGSTGAALLNFLWSTIDGSFVAGTTTPKVQIDEPGQYRLLVTNPGNGCTDTDDVLIMPRDPIAKAVVKQPNCFGEKGSILVDTVAGGKPPFTYSMDGGQHYTSQNFFANLAPGNYSILVLDALGCATTLTATIIAALPFEITLEPQALIGLGESYQIEMTINSPQNIIANVQWTPATGLNCDTCLNPIATPLMTTQYKVVIANDKGCTDNAALLLRVDRRVDVYVPNVFSPNGDNNNDVFMIFASERGVKEIKSFQVFDRWGEIVYEYAHFQPNDPAFGWDGNLNGQVMNPAVFVWYAVVELIDGSEVLYKGDVTLER